MEQLRFEWDEDKNKQNIRKHGVSFEEAQTLFFDEYALRFFDPDHSEDEDRFIMLGMSYKLRVLKNETAIRIISTRKATQNEARNYRR